MHEFVGLIEIMPPDTAHGVSAITNPTFIIFAAFEISVTLNRAQRSFQVIHFGSNESPCIDR